MAFVLSAWTAHCIPFIQKESSLRCNSFPLLYRKPSSLRNPCISTIMAQKKGSPTKTSTTSKKEAKVDYWPGEWICVDCGYTYKPGRKVKFEDLPASWKCPQCNAPKRRFAKKAGDFVAETAETSNTPIIIFSILGLLATMSFGIWAAYNL